MTTNTTLPEIRESLDVFAQQMEAAELRQQATTGRDPSSTVEVRLDAGGRIEAIAVSGGWQSRLAAHEVAPAVLAAAADAAATRMAAWADHLADAIDEPRRPRPPQARTEDFHSRLNAAAGEEVDPEHLREVLAQVSNSLDQALELTREVQSRVFEARSSSRRVLAGCRLGGDLVVLDIDLDWLARGAHPVNIGRESLQAVLSAYQQATTAALQMAQTLGSLGHLQQLLESPEELGAAIRSGQV